MDLQWQRQVELWLRLMEAPGIPPASQVTLRQNGDTCYLETLEGRALLSLARPLPEACRQPALLRLLTLLHPEAGNGLPLRAWVAHDSLWLAAAPPQDSGAELWAQLACQFRRLLDRVTEDKHEAQ
ncbi:MAG: hypothetical protein JHC61_06805 [Burkholderiaceae bacterium]|nr:hypothetical protein [Burkholderiaceae bacterium]